MSPALLLDAHTNLRIARITGPVPGARVVLTGASSAADEATFRRQLHPSMVIGRDHVTGWPVMWDGTGAIWSERPERLHVTTPARSTVDGDQA